MFLTVHTAVGAAIGKVVPNPILAFILGFISHFILDIIPHGDEKWLEIRGQKKRLIRFIIIGMSDVLGMMIIIFALFKENFLNQPPSVISGILGSVIPDFLNMAYFVLKPKFLRGFSIIHTIFHDWIKKPPFTYLNELLIQLCLLLVFISIIFG